MPTIFIPAQLRDLTGGQATVTVNATTAGEALDLLEVQFPGLRDRLCTASGLRPELQMIIDGTVLTRNLRTPLLPASELHFLPAISGG